MQRVEFHCHTIYSRDCLVWIPDFLKACQRKGIDRVVITDHNTTAGGRLAQQLDPERVIVGEEIMTQDGELLAAFVQEEIPAGLPSGQVIEELRGQGAFISVSHPFDVMRAGHWQPERLAEIAPLVDAVEVFNARCYLRSYNQQAANFARQRGLLGTVGSDAHTAWELGTAVLLLPPFHDGDSLRKAMETAQMQVSYSPWWVRFSSRYAVLYKALRRTIFPGLPPFT